MHATTAQTETQGNGLGAVPWVPTVWSRREDSNLRHADCDSALGRVTLCQPMPETTVVQGLSEPLARLYVASCHPLPNGGLANA